MHDEPWWHESDCARDMTWLAHLLWFVAGFGFGCLAIVVVTT